MADAIFTISVEEAWWLQLHGIAAEPLPYYPPRKHLVRLQRIRHCRRPDPECGLLWLADFRNPANQQGLSLTLDWLAEHAPQGIPLKVVGRGIENVRDQLNTSRLSQFQMLGELRDEELEDLQCRCLAQVIVHPATSGMLTRVIDAAVAGIPILGNSMALKSYRHFFSGAQSGSNRSFSPRVLSVPTPPDSEAELFLASLK
jgi:hypothetical protein